jgi:hypothetical protein
MRGAAAGGDFCVIRRLFLPVPLLDIAVEDINIEKKK